MSDQTTADKQKHVYKFPGIPWMIMGLLCLRRHFLSPKRHEMTPQVSCGSNADKPLVKRWPRSSRLVW